MSIPTALDVILSPRSRSPDRHQGSRQEEAAVRPAKEDLPAARRASRQAAARELDHQEEVARREEVDRQEEIVRRPAPAARVTPAAASSLRLLRRWRARKPTARG